MSEIPKNLVNDIPSSEIVEIALCEQSLLYFIRKAWHILEPTTVFQSGWHLEAICEHLEAATKREIRNLIVNMPPRHMKLIRDDELVPTLEGWTTHGNLNIGDFVFSPNGSPIEIINKTSRDIADTEVEFSDGSIIKCNGEHLWTVYDRTIGEWRTETTDYLATRVLVSGKEKSRCNFQLPRIKPLQFEEKELPIHPYFLGVWLGDGTSNKPCISHDEKDIEHLDYLKEIGYEVTNV